jgi:hypothetical protein
VVKRLLILLAVLAILGGGLTAWAVNRGDTSPVAPHLDCNGNTEACAQFNTGYPTP